MYSQNPTSGALRWECEYRSSLDIWSTPGMYFDSVAGAKVVIIPLSTYLPIKYLLAQ